MRFRDREEAGRRLAALVQVHAGENPIVLGLPRGGVVVADEVARALGAPLDVLVVRKIGAPGQPELGLGAVAEGGAVVIDHSLASMVGARESDIQRTIGFERAEVARRVKRFRGGRPAPDIKGRTVIVVDDGIATGGTVKAALQALRSMGPERLVLAVPVAATQSLQGLRNDADEVDCLFATEYLGAVGAWYDDFAQVEDEEVVRRLEQARARMKGAAAHQAAGSAS